MRDDNARHVERPEKLPHLAPHWIPQGVIERREWLIQQHEAWISGQRTTESDALPLPARQLCRKPSRHPFQMYPSQDRSDAIVIMRCGSVHPEPNVLLDGEMGKEAVVLRDVRETSPLGRPIDTGCRVEPDLLAEPDEAFLRAIQSGKAAQDRRLA